MRLSISNNHPFPGTGSFSSASANLVEEFDEDNNAWFSAAADITIERRPNLRIGSIEYSNDLSLLDDELSFDVTVMNDGLGEVPFGQGFDIALFLQNATPGNEEEIALTVFPETLGLVSGESVVYGITVPAPVGLVIGDSYRVGARADVAAEVAESNELDNVNFSVLPELVFGQTEVGEALDLQGGSADWELANGATETVSWFGQTTETFDGESTAQSGRIGDGATSAFTVAVTLPEPVLVSFHWKVSSETVDGPNGVAGDFLRFSTGGEEIAKISGEVDWTRVTLALPAGESLLTWEYSKNLAGASGADAGWVDAIRFDPIALEVTLDEALDDASNPLPGGWLNSGWRAGGDRSWIGQGERTLLDGSSSAFDGSDSAQSGRIGAGETSWVEREIEVSPTGPAKLTFRWKISSAADTAFLAFSLSGNEKERITGTTDWVEKEFLIPAGPQILRWTYQKSAGQSGGEDAGFLDQVEIVELELPDLVVTDVVFTPGEYVLQRDRLPLQVTVENQGAALGGIIWDASDLAVRLSADTDWGNSGDVILGRFAKVESFDSGSRLVFSGDITLPLDAPAGDYYLGVLVDPFEKIEEWDRANNFAWSDIPEVAIARLPNFVLDGFGLGSVEALYPGSAVGVDFRTRNAGLGPVLGDQVFFHRIELRARPALEEEIPEDEDLRDWTGETLVAVLAEVEDSKYMPGVSTLRPQGSTVDYQTRLGLPGELALLQAVGIVDQNFTSAMLTDEDREKLNDWEFSLILALDSNFSVAESSEVNVYAREGLGLFAIRPVLAAESDSRTIQKWTGEREIVLPESDAPEFGELLRQYALNLGGPSPSPSARAYGFEMVDDAEYIRMTFDIVTGANDLRYLVEVSDNLVDWSPLLAVEPPFSDQHGENSLTGIGGLIESPLVLSASDQGYTAAITIRDATPVAESPGRFLRLKIVYLTP